MQQINLYQQQFQPRRVVLPFLWVLGLGLAWIVLLGMYSFMQSAQRAELQARVAGLEADQLALNEKVVVMEVAASRLHPNRLLESKVLKLNEDLLSRQRILGQLKNEASLSGGGFSPYLEGLARQHQDGTWLTRLDIQAQGRGLVLGGQALRADLVPAYMQRLGGEPVFQGIGLQVMNLHRPAQPGLPVSFELRTRIKQEQP